MKTQFLKRTGEAFTLLDLLVVIAVLLILAAVLMPVPPATKRRAPRINCVNNLKQVNLAFRIWEGDNHNQYPMSYTAANGVEWPATTNIAVYFQAISNELVKPKLLICPADRKHVPATNWTTDFNNSHVSYFLNLDASQAYPQELLSGDDNFAINGVPAKPGLLLLSTNTAISWTAERHVNMGNLSFADGSVAEESNSGLQNSSRMSVEGTPISTNRLAIP